MKILIAVILLGMSTLSFSHQYHAPHGVSSDIMDSKIMLQVKQLMVKGRQESNEQYYLKASKLLDKVKTSSAQKTLFRAEIQQYFHRFNQALTTLNSINHTASTDLLRASIYFTQGKFRQAHQHCKNLFGQVDTLLALTCISHANSLQGELDKAYEVLVSALEHVKTDSSSSRLWAYVTLAEMAERKLDYEMAKQLYTKALEINPTDMPTRIAYADILLNERNAIKTILVTQDYLHNDLLLLRYVRANSLYEKNEDNKAYIRLKDRIENYTRENQHLHYDLLAEYQLYIKLDAQQALVWAERHWQQQKTPRDARLLATVAEQVGDISSKQRVINWQQNYGLEDKLLERILAKQKLSLQ